MHINSNYHINSNIFNCGFAGRMKEPLVAKNFCHNIMQRRYGANIYTDFDTRFSSDRFLYFDIKDHKEFNPLARAVVIRDRKGNPKYLSTREINPNDEFHKQAVRVYDKNGKLIKHVHEDEIESLLNYQSNGFRNINRALRLHKKTPIYYIFQNDIQHIDSLFYDENIYSTMPRNTIVYRAVKIDEDNKDFGLQNLKAGDVFEERGYLSTTRSRELLPKFGNVHLEIEVPKGTKYLDIPVLSAHTDFYDNESEMVFDRDTKLVVESISSDKQRIRLKMKKSKN